MIKFIMMSVLVLAGFAAHAETELACWNIYAKKGSRPILKAKISDGTTLSDLRFDFSGENFEIYFIDKDEDAGERWGHKRAITKSYLTSKFEGDFTPEEITSNRSPYKGNNEYDIELGAYSFKSPYYNIEGTYDGRLILPKDLSSANLKKFRFPNVTRSNAVMIYPPAYESSQSGDNYLRMNCSSR